MQGIIADIKEMKKRGNGIMLIVVTDGFVSGVSTSFADSSNDIILTYKALKAVKELGFMETLFKKTTRKDKIDALINNCRMKCKVDYNVCFKCMSKKVK